MKTFIQEGTVTDGDKISINVHKEQNEQGAAISLELEGFGTKSVVGDCPIIYLERWNGETRLLVWNDINEEDPQVILLDKARQENYF